MLVYGQQSIQSVQHDTIRIPERVGPTGRIDAAGNTEPTVACTTAQILNIFSDLYIAVLHGCLIVLSFVKTRTSYVTRSPNV